MAATAVTILNPTIAVTLDNDTIAVELSSDVIAVTLPQGAQGEAGPTGPASGAVVTYPAGQNLSSGRVVIIEGGEAVYFQPSDNTHAGRAFGVTTTSALTGADVDIQTAGVATDAAFAFTADSTLFSSANGLVVDTMPGGGTVQQVGTSISADTMLISIQSSITRN